METIVTGRVTQTVETRVSATEWAGNVTEDVSLDGGIPNVTQVRSLLIDWVFGDLRRIKNVPVIYIKGLYIWIVG